jgi:hypothetical protein
MSTNDSGRIPPQFEKLVPYLQLTDNYQLADDPDNPGQPRFEKWKWEDADSAQWTEFRTEADALFIDYDAENFVNKNVRDKIKVLVRNVQEYDHDRDTGHKLLDKVALYGNVDDCNTFRVKRGTVLADETPTHSAGLGNTKPQLALRSSSPGEHEFAVTNPDTPESRALPPGVSFCDVHRCIYDATKPPASIKDYELIGVPSRGIFLSKFEDQTFDRTKKYYASYIARYRGKSGEIGLFGNELVVLVDDSGSRGIVN